MGLTDKYINLVLILIGVAVLGIGLGIWWFFIR